MKKVCVIVPVYNVEEYLDKCLDSLVNQTSNNYDIIVINDGTKDNSQVIIDDYRNRYPDKIKSYIKENGGLSDARNYGLKYADTEYVMFVDSDDYVEKTMIEDALNGIKDSDILVFSYYQHHIKNNVTETIDNKINNGSYSLFEKPEILAYTPNAAWNKLYRKRLFDEIKYPIDLYYEDLGTTPKLLLKSKRIAFLNKPLYHYLVDRPNNITKEISNKIYDLFEILKGVLEYYKANNAFETFYDELYYITMRNIITNLKKVLTSTNKQFVIEYIDTAFDFVNFHFPKKSNKYNLFLDSDDKIYISRTLCKLYYFYRTIRKKNKVNQ